MSTARKTHLPSIKTLELAFADNAKDARRVLEMTREEMENHPIGAARVRECYHTPQNYDVRLSILNVLGGFHGIEALEGTRGEWAPYLNAGDCYAPTVIYWRGRYRVQSLGDFVETMERQGVKFK